MHRVILSNPLHRLHAHRLIDAAPDRSVMQIEVPRRTIPQNEMLWARLSEISAQKPGGRKWRPEVWKAAFMSAFGIEGEIAEGLLGEPLPLGFRSSKLTVAQMSDLHAFIEAWCVENSVILSKMEGADAARR